MLSLLSTIFGNITFDDRTSSYYWHPWMNDDPPTTTHGYTDDPDIYDDE